MIGVLILVLNRHPVDGTPEFWVYRIFLALGTAFVATALPGTINIELPSGVKGGRCASDLRARMPTQSSAYDERQVRR
jgi:hypothetical protein